MIKQNHNWKDNKVKTVLVLNVLGGLIKGCEAQLDL